MNEEIKRELESVTWLGEKGAKTLPSVAAFLSKAECINETAPMWTKWHKFWRKKSSNYWLWNVLRVWFFLKHRFNHRSKRTEAVRFYDISCGSWTEQVCNPFAQRRHHVSTYDCLIELKTEFELEQAFSMQLRNKIIVVRTSEFTTLVC